MQPPISRHQPGTPANAVDAEELILQRETVVFAADQPPFQHAGEGGSTNIFCVLVPLMTEAGRVFGKLEQEFPNRGRVWWMLSKEINPNQVTPGTIFTGHLEHAQKYTQERSRASKDAYQVDRRSVTPGARRYVQVIDVPEADPDVGRLMREEGIQLERPPLQVVLFRGSKTIVGPFRASYDWVTDTARLEVLQVGQPRVFRAPRELFKSGQLKEFSFVSNQWNPNSPKEQIALVLLHRDHLERLEKEGSAEDALSDAQVMKWGLEQVGFTRSERSEVERVLAKLSVLGKAAESTELAPRIERFRRLCESRAKVADLPLEVAQLLVDKQETFRPLVEHWAEKLAEGRIQSIVTARRQELDAAVAEQEKRLALLRDEIKELQESLEQKRREQEETLRRDHEAMVSAHEAKVRELEAHTRAVEERLQRVTGIYKEGSRELVDRLLAELPLLRALGILGGQGQPAEIAAAPNIVPPFLVLPKKRSSMPEAEFLAQLADVVARHEYVFEKEDLANFHVSLKTGVWTVLAGPSGIGKSSLPRLYAEALGQSDEFLMLPVQPDWLDAHAVLGAFNGLSQRFEPAVGGLTDRLIAAAQDQAKGRGGIYVVCLDEMNLSRVEHYFAWFLSVMELPAAERRLSLFAAGQERAGDPYAPWRVVPLGDNLRFVGTVNIDETTHFMSPKVLDRTPVLTLDRAGSSPGSFGGKSEGRLGGIRDVHLQDYRSWIRPPVRDGRAMDLLFEVDRRVARSQAGLGFRVLNRVLGYLGSAKGLLSEDRALDFAFAQMVVPRLRASSATFLDLVADLAKLLPESRFPRTADLLRKLAEAEGERDFFQLL